MVSERGTESLGMESTGMDSVKRGSKLETSVSDSCLSKYLDVDVNLRTRGKLTTLGLKGGWTCRRRYLFQSTSEKKGWALTSWASLGPPPNLCRGSLSRSYLK
jgi:hypothetical protein